MAMPGIEDQGAEDAAKPRVNAMRESQTDTARFGSLSFHVDMRPGTVLEQSQNNGYDRTSKPVGAATPNPAEFESVGGRGSTDALAARQLGSQGRK